MKVPQVRALLLGANLGALTSADGFAVHRAQRRDGFRAKQYNQIKIARSSRPSKPTTNLRAPL